MILGLFVQPGTNGDVVEEAKSTLAVTVGFGRNDLEYRILSCGEAVI